MSKSHLEQDVTSIQSDVKEIFRLSRKIEVDVVRIGGHLETLNGSVSRHETDITAIKEDIVHNKIDTAKLMTKVGLGGAAVGTVITVLLKMVGL